MRKQLLLLLGLAVVATVGLACDRDGHYVRDRHEHRRSYRSCDDDGPRYERRSYRSYRRSRHGHARRHHVEGRRRTFHD